VLRRAGVVLLAGALLAGLGQTAAVADPSAVGDGSMNWLVVVWRLPWYIPIVFPLEVCHTDQVGVQEAQVLSGLPPQ
jgi:hypothetical protein